MYVDSSAKKKKRIVRKDALANNLISSNVIFLMNVLNSVWRKSCTFVDSSAKKE